MVKAKSPLFTRLSKGFKFIDARFRRRGDIELGLKRIPYNPRTQSQQKHRKKYGRCVSSWRGLESTVKEAYNEEAPQLGLSGWNLYIKEWLMLKALNFYTDKYVTIADAPSLNPEDEICFELLVYTRLTPQYSGLIFKWWEIHGIMASTDPATYPEKLRWYFFLTLVGGKRFFTTPWMLRNKWYHVIAQYSSITGNVEWYQNGEKRVLASGLYEKIAYEAGTWYIGRSAYFFDGMVALVRQYNRILSQKEARHNMVHLSNPVRRGLVLWLDARYIVNNTWKDLSGYGNHGTIYGATQVDVFDPA